MSYQKLRALKDQVSELDDSPSKGAILEEAIRIADSLGDIPEGLLLRDNLILCAFRSGQEEKAFAVFPWCVAARRKWNAFVSHTSSAFFAPLRDAPSEKGRGITPRRKGRGGNARTRANWTC